ncbi:MAG: TonB-dependent receptor [Chitinophagaceae bacterium]|jgi:outer membrane receptor protein involved in Fe transport|nr:TonB-dependent receptor [Chitinophagaceae bacterium]
MKIGILGIVFTFLLITAYGQEKVNETNNGAISGALMDSSEHTPLQSATVILYLAGKKMPISHTVSDANGMFGFAKLASGNYAINIAFVGFRTVNLKNIIINQKNRVIDLKQINVAKEQNALQSVVVTSSVKPVENKIDRLVYNVEKDITSQTGVATDVLKKVPMISVDVDGNVDLAGATGIRFLIDGKPSTVFGSNIADVLQAIPANQIKSIEVITNPGAKYDAQGTAGIINIILKHNNMQGINGNVSLTTGTIMQSGSFNFNVRNGKFGVNAFISGNARLNTTSPSDLQRTSIDTATQITTILHQASNNDFRRYGFQSGAGFDWSPDVNNSFTGAFRYSEFGFKRTNGIINQTEQNQDAAGNILSVINTVNYGNGAFDIHSFDPSLNYKHKFKNPDQQLEIGADASFSHNSDFTNNDQYLQPKDSLIYGTRNDNPAKQNQYEMMVDYVQPLHENVTLGVGGKFSGSNIDGIANALLWTPDANNYLYNSSLSNNLNYHQRVYAGYAELNFPISKTLSARLGGRYERTEIHAFYQNANQAIQKGYNTFIPSVFLMKKIDETQTLKLNFTLRINRPGYMDLNPFVNTADPKNISMGNPDLKPEIWDRYEASYNKDLGKTGSLMAMLFYRQSNGDIQSFMTYYPSINIGDTVYTNTSVSIRENIGTEKNAGGNVYFDFHANDKLSFRTDALLMYRYTVNKVDTGYNSHGTIYRFNINTSYQFPNNFAAEFFGSYNSRHHEAQGNYPAFIYYSAAFRKQFWKKNGSIALTANNFFSNYVNQRTDLYGPGFTSSSLRQIPFRSIGINFTWKFGHLEMKKEKTEDNNPDAGVPQS